MTETTPPYRYIDGDSFCLSARLLPDLNTGGVTDTLSITIEGSDEPQSVHVPAGDVSTVAAGIVAAAGQQPAATVPAPAPTDRCPHGCDVSVCPCLECDAEDAAAVRAAILREAEDAIEGIFIEDENPDERSLGFNEGLTQAIDELRRLADAASGPGRADGETQQDETQADTRDAIIAELVPAWEALYEPGNVSTYLIGYANDQDAATGMAEAWLRSQAEVTGRLEWLDEKQLATDRYDRWFELIERHDDGIDTGPGIVVRRRAEQPAAVSQPDGQA